LSEHSNNYNNLIGQPELKARLNDTFVDGYPVNHAYLFSADTGMGKTSFALKFAKQILCLENDSNNKACGSCDACRYFMAGTLPDFKHIQKGKEKIIKIDRVRKEIIADIQMRPQISRRKVYLLSLDDLNEQGQNALLKSLEEPPEYVVFLLTTKLAENILDTILSRVITLNFARYSKQEIKQILSEKVKKSEAEIPDGSFETQQDLNFILSYANGNPGLALQISQDENFKANRKQAIEWFFHFPTSDRTTLLTEYLDYLNKNKDQIYLFYHIWQDLIHDLLILLEDDSINKVAQVDILERCRKLVNYYQENDKTENRKQKLLHAYSAISEVKQASEVNASFEGMIGQLLLTLRKDLHI